jgi:hypothetical protein
MQMMTGTYTAHAGYWNVTAPVPLESNMSTSTPYYIFGGAYAPLVKAVSLVNLNGYAVTMRRTWDELWPADTWVRLCGGSRLGAQQCALPIGAAPCPLRRSPSGFRVTPHLARVLLLVHLQWANATYVINQTMLPFNTTSSPWWQAADSREGGIQVCGRGR